MATIAGPMVHDELEGVVAALCASAGFGRVDARRRGLMSREPSRTRRFAAPGDIALLVFATWGTKYMRRMCFRLYYQSKDCASVVVEESLLAKGSTMRSSTMDARGIANPRGRLRYFGL